jgi:hypothetical protein
MRGCFFFFHVLLRSSYLFVRLLFPVPLTHRFAFSIMWELDEEGVVVPETQWIGRTVIKSVAKLAYQHAQMVRERDANREHGYCVELLCLFLYFLFFPYTLFFFPI